MLVNELKFLEAMLLLDLTLLWPASLSHQVRPFLGCLSSSVYSSRNYRDTNSSIGAESGVLYSLYRAQALWGPMHGALLTQRISGSYSNGAAASPPSSSLLIKYCSPCLLKSSFCDGKQTTSKQIKAQAPKAFPYLAKSLGTPARPINASTCPAVQQPGWLEPGTAALGFQTQGCEHAGLGPCLTRCLKHFKDHRFLQKHLRDVALTTATSEGFQLISYPFLSHLCASSSCKITSPPPAFY